MGETITFIVNDIPMQAILSPKLLEVIRKQEVEATKRLADVAEIKKFFHAIISEASTKRQKYGQG